MNDATTDKEEKIMKIDYNEMVYKSIHLLLNSVKNLKFFLDNDLQHEEYEQERNDKIKYSILEDLKELIRYLNHSNMNPEYDLKLIIIPRFSKKENDDAYWR